MKLPAQQPDIGFRRLVRLGIAHHTNNVGYRRMRALFDSIEEISCPENPESVEVSVGVGYIDIRAAIPDAIRTVVSNTGAGHLLVYEDDQLVCLVPPNQSRITPLRGRNRISARTNSGTSEVVITTYVLTRCVVADPCLLVEEEMPASYIVQPGCGGTTLVLEVAEFPMYVTPDAGGGFAGTGAYEICPEFYQIFGVSLTRDLDSLWVLRVWNDYYEWDFSMGQINPDCSDPTGEYESLPGGVYPEYAPSISGTTWTVEAPE